MSDDADTGAPASIQPDGLPERRVTCNQLVAFNMSAYRKVAGMTQDELGERLGGWSFASVSAAERSWVGKRVRKFDADEIVRIADALGVPVIAMFLPPPDAGTALDYVFDFGGAVPDGLPDMLAHLAPSYGLPETPALAAYRDRLIALGAVAPAANLVTDHPAAAEVLSRALAEADEIVTSAAQRGVQLTSDARARAEGLERDAQDRHRRALGSLIGTREELERRVGDLAAFERDYRIRLTAWLEDQLADLRSGSEVDPQTHAVFDSLARRSPRYKPDPAEPGSGP